MRSESVMGPGAPPAQDTKNTCRKKKKIHGTSVRITFYLLNNCQLSRGESQRGIKWEGLLYQLLRCLLLGSD